MNKITFTAKNPYGWEVAPRPFPASELLPNWWRAQTPYMESEQNPTGKKLIVSNKSSNASFKKCTPMLDSLTVGYIIPLWSDVYVSQVNNSPNISWKTSEEVFSVHGGVFESNTVIPPKVQKIPGYSDMVFKYHNFWIPRTPKGYSCLFTTPFGYQDGVFKAVTAVIDTDRISVEVLPPVWVKEGFEGVVERGTPISLVIPFKRDNWKAEFDFLEEGKYRYVEDLGFKSTIANNYVKKSWSKKTFK